MRMTGGERFSIRPAWPDAMVYEDAACGSIAFDCRSIEEPPQINVPSAQRWAAWTPPWAHTQRKRIVERLRASGCVVFEEADACTTALSRDGTMRVELHRTEDERSGVWTTVQVIRLPDEEVLVSETDYRGTTMFRFPRPGVVEVSMTDRAGARRYFEVNAASRSFRMHPSGADEPLALLPARLGRIEAPRAFASSPARTALGGAIDLLCAFGSLLFVLGGAWVLMAGQASKDRWIGALGIVFFGFCFAASWSDWRRYRQGSRARRT